MQVSQSNSTMLLNSSSLKDLLGGGGGATPPRKRKMNIAKNEELVDDILKHSVLTKKAKTKMAKKKVTKKKKSLLDRKSVGTGITRAKQALMTLNNVYEYAILFGLERDYVDQLERQFLTSKYNVQTCIDQLLLGFEQLNGSDAVAINDDEAGILLALLGIELEDRALLVHGRPYPPGLLSINADSAYEEGAGELPYQQEQQGKVLGDSHDDITIVSALGAPASGSGAGSIDSVVRRIMLELVNEVMARSDDEAAALAAADSITKSAASYTSSYARPPPARDDTTANASADAVEVKDFTIPADSAGQQEKEDSESRPQQQQSKAMNLDKFVTAFRNYLRIRLMVLSLGEMNGFAQKNSASKFIGDRHSPDRQSTSSQYPTLLDYAQSLDSSQLPMDEVALHTGGTMDGSLFNDAQSPDDAAGILNTSTANNNNDDENGGGGGGGGGGLTNGAAAAEGKDVSSSATMFVSTVSFNPNSQMRPNSQPDSRIFVENDANAIFSKSDRNAAAAGAGADDHGNYKLPPLRLAQINKRKLQKELGLTLNKKQFAKAGFDASFTRGTPRVLQSVKPMVPAAEAAIHGGGASLSEIEALRYELTVAKEGLKHLNQMVDTNIAWVQTNCDITSLAPTFSDRTRQKCKNMATERIVAVYSNLVKNTLFWGIKRWRAAVHYEKLTVVAKTYSKLKAIEKLTNTLHTVACKQLMKGWQPWLQFVQHEILKAREAGAVKIQSLARGKAARNRVTKLKLGTVATVLQQLFRKTKAKSVIKEKRWVKEQQLNAVAIKAIQKLFTKLIRIRLAKAEAQRRRTEKATIRIQKMHRGNTGRKLFLHHKENMAKIKDSAPDLEKLAAPKNPKPHHSPKVAKAAEHSPQQHHDTKKRSLFHPSRLFGGGKEKAPSGGAAAAADSSEHHSRSHHSKASSSPQSSNPSSVHAPSATAAAAAAAAGTPDQQHQQQQQQHQAPATTSASAAGEESLPAAPAATTSPAGTKKTRNRSAPLRKNELRKAGAATGSGASGSGSEEGGTKRRTTFDPKSTRGDSHSHSHSSGGGGAVHKRSPQPSATASSTRLAARREKSPNPHAGGASSVHVGRSKRVPASSSSSSSSGGGGGGGASRNILRSTAGSKPYHESNSSAGRRSRSGSPKTPSSHPSTTPPLPGAGGGEATTAAESGGDASGDAAMAEGAALFAPIDPASVTALGAAAAVDPLSSSGDRAVGLVQVASSEQLHHESLEDDILASDAMLHMLQQQNAVEDMQDGDLSNTSTTLDESGTSRSSRRSSSQKKATKRPTDTKDAAKSIQKIARGKLARQRSKKLREDGSEDVSDASGSHDAHGSVKESSSVGTLDKLAESGGDVADATMTPAAADDSIAASQNNTGVEGLNSSNLGNHPMLGGLEDDQQQRASMKSDTSSTFEGPRPRSTGLFGSLRMRFSTRGSSKVPGAGSRDSTPNSSIRRGFAGGGRGGGGEEDGSGSETGGGGSGADAADQRPRSTSFFRGLFGGFGSRGSSRESSPLQQRPHTTSGTPSRSGRHGSGEFGLSSSSSQQGAIKEEGEENTSGANEDPHHLREVQSAKVIQSRARGMRDRRAVILKRQQLEQMRNDAPLIENESEKSSKRTTSGKAGASAKKKTLSAKSSRATADTSAKQQQSTAPPPNAAANTNTTTCTGTSVGASSSSARLGSSKAPGSVDSTTGGGGRRSQRNSFDKESGVSRSGSRTPPRRKSFDKEAPLPAVAVDPEKLKLEMQEKEEREKKWEEEKERLRKEKEEQSKLAKEKVERRKAEAEEKRKADAAKAREARAERESKRKGPSPAASSVRRPTGADAASKRKPSLAGGGGGTGAGAGSPAVSVGASRPTTSESKPGSSSSSSKGSRKSTPTGGGRKRNTSAEKEAEAAAAAAAAEGEGEGAGEAEDTPALLEGHEEGEEGQEGQEEGDTGTGTGTGTGSAGDVQTKKAESQGGSSSSSKKMSEKMKSPSAAADSGASSPPGIAPGSPPPPSKPPPLDPHDAAATRIQTRVRMKSARRILGTRKEHVIDTQKQIGLFVHWAVVTIQRNLRGRVGRQKYEKLALAKQAIIAHKQAKSAALIQARARGAADRKRVVSLKAEKRERDFINQYRKKEAEERNGSGGAKSKKRGAGKTSGYDDPDDESTPILAEKEAELDDKIRKLEEMEAKIREREEKMAEHAKAAEDRAAAMDRALQQIEEQAKKQEADRMAQQMLMQMAAGNITNRSDYQQNTGRRSLGPASARGPGDAPPTARSARGGAGIPPDAPRLTYQGEEWVQLWDPDEYSYYWYNEATQAAQWETPGQQQQLQQQLNHGASANTMVVNYNSNINAGGGGGGADATVAGGGTIQEGDDSGYESAGAMTDYSTDRYDEHSQYTSDSEFGEHVEWQEYWDEQAQAKYWYNNNTGEASWTRPEGVEGSVEGSETSDNASSYQLALIPEEDPSSALSVSSANEWVSYIDDETEQAYWYNIRTGETSWA